MWLAYLVFIGEVLCPIAWLLGQTVPILSNLMMHDHMGHCRARGSFRAAFNLRRTAGAPAVASCRCAWTATKHSG